MSSHLVFGQDEMFTLIRKIPVDDLGVTGQIDACEFSKDNYYIIATDNHATAKIYIRETGEFVNQVKHIDIKNDQFERAGKINALGYSYDRKYFFTGINDYGLKLWDAENYTLVYHFYRTKEVDGATFSSDGKWLAIGAGNTVYALSGRDQYCKIHLTSDGNYIFTGGVVDGIMRVWRRSDWSLIGTVQAQEINRQIEYIDVSSDNEVIVGGDEGVLYHYKFNPPAILEPFVSSIEGSNIISCEAEHFDSNVPFGGTAWETQNVENASGKITMKALPNSGRDIYRDKFITFDPTKDAPKLDYRIDFPEAGKWYIWILGRGGYNDNMVHVGMFDKEVGSAKSINWGERSAAEFSWTNSNINKNGAPAFVHITNMGVHTLNIVMQQDGVEIDKIILTMDKDYDPSNINGGKGPESSIR